MSSVKIYVEYYENETILKRTFNYNKTYLRRYNEDQKIYLKENDTLILNILETDDFITKILKWCDNNNGIFSYNTKNINKIHIYDEDNPNDTFIKYSIVNNEILTNINMKYYKIINLSYKFKHNNILYNNDINVIINTYNYNNSLIQMFNIIFIHITYNNYF